MAQALPLFPELALLLSRLSQHKAALLLLALMPPHMVDGAITYCWCVTQCNVTLPDHEILHICTSLIITFPTHMLVLHERVTFDVAL